MEIALREKLKQAFSGEKIARAVFLALAAFSVLAVLTIIGYLLYAAVPAFRDNGFFSFIFGSEWSAKNNVFGVWRMIAGTFTLTLTSALLGGTLGVFTAVWLVYYCPRRLKKAYTQIVNLLAGIPSIVYGLFGYKFLMPLLVDIFKPDNAGFGLLACTLILSIMITPTITSVTRNSLESAPSNYLEGALALGSTKNQTIWKVLVPSAKRGITSAIILGVGRAIGETMAVQMIVGNGSGYPGGAFVPFTTLTSNIVQNWGYAGPSEQAALIADGFILLIIILALNLCLSANNKERNGTGLFRRGHICRSRKYASAALTDEANRSGSLLHIRNARKSEKVIWSALASADTAAEPSAPISHAVYRRTGKSQNLLCCISWIVAAITAFVLVFIVGFVFVKGLPNLSVDFLFGKSSNAGTTLAPAFVSTIMLIGLALAIALPLGIGAAIYLNEYSTKTGKAVKIIRLFIDTLAGIPSIIFGLFGMVFFVKLLGTGYSLTAGGITLAMIILPTVIRSTEQSLSEVPDNMLEASYALGAGKLRTIFSVVLPLAVSGIVTSVILSIGRIVNESAALIFTVGSASTFIPQGYGDGAASFAVLVWKFMSNGLEVDKAYATAAVLLIFVIILNLAVSLAEWFFKRRKAR